MTNKRLPVVAVALLLLTAGCLGAVGLGDDEDDSSEDDEDLPDADELLEAASNAETSVETVQGTQTTTWDDGEETVTTTQDVWERAPNEYRAEIVDSDDPEPIDVMVSDGSTMWMYDANENEAISMSFGFDQAEQDAMNDGFADAFMADMDASVEGTDTVADRDVYVLELTADGEDAIADSATLWIDQETEYPIKQEQTMSVGQEMTMTIAFEDVTFDAEIDDDVFTFEPPEDAEVRDFDDLRFEQYDDIAAAEETTPFDIPEPEVPDEYALESVMVNENMVGWSASLQYASDGDGYLAVTIADDQQEPLFEPDSDPVEIDGVDAAIRDVTDTDRALEWDEGGLSYTVTGDLTDEELIAIAESIVD